MAIAIPLPCVVIVVVLVLLNFILEFIPSQAQACDSIAVLQNGTLLRTVLHADGTTSRLSMDGQPLLDPATTAPMDMAEIKKQLAPAVMVANYGESSRESVPWRIYDKTFWFLTRSGELRGYNALTRRYTGSILPPADGNGKPQRFRPELGHSYWSSDFQHPSAGYLATTSTLYAVDVADGSLRPIFTTTDGNEIVNFGNTCAYHHYEYDATSEVATNTQSPLLIITRKQIAILPTPASLPIIVPVKPSSPDALVYLHSLQPDGYVVQTSPGYRYHNTRPDIFTWLSAQGMIRRSIPFHPIPWVEPTLPLGFAIFCPPSVLLQAWFSDDWRIDLAHVLLALAAACLCLGVAWKRGRDFRFAAWRQWLWGAWILLTGVSGLFAFFAVQHWPVRIPCPACGRRRTIGQDACEHCNAPLPPPPQDGTELLHQEN